MENKEIAFCPQRLGFGQSVDTRLRNPNQFGEFIKVGEILKEGRPVCANLLRARKINPSCITLQKGLETCPILLRGSFSITVKETTARIVAIQKRKEKLEEFLCEQELRNYPLIIKNLEINGAKNGSPVQVPGGEYVNLYEYPIRKTIWTVGVFPEPGDFESQIQTTFLKILRCGHGFEHCLHMSAGRCAVLNKFEYPDGVECGQIDTNMDYCWSDKWSAEQRAFRDIDL